MGNPEKRTSTGLSSALEGLVKKPEGNKPTKAELAQVGEGLGYRHAVEPNPKPVKRARRPRVAKMQLNHSITVESVELFERVAEKNIQMKKGALLEMAIQLLADSQGVK